MTNRHSRYGEFNSGQCIPCAPSASRRARARLLGGVLTVMARRQQERSAQTRRSLLDGAVHCLNADGYKGLTGVRVCEHIGISRGAMLHQFPTRTVFLAGIVDHILERRLTETDTLIQHALEAPNRVLRWRVISQHYQTPIFCGIK